MARKDTHTQYLTGQTTVGTSAVPLVGTALAGGNERGVLVKAYGDNDVAANTVPVFIGNAQVTVSTGFPIAPGEAVTIPVTGRGAALYAVASVNTQNIAWISI